MTGVIDGNIRLTLLFETGNVPANRRKASYCLSGVSCRRFSALVAQLPPVKQEDGLDHRA